MPLSWGRFEKSMRCLTYNNCCCCLVAKSCLTLCNPMDCSPRGSSVHVISQAGKVAISFSRGPFSPGIKPVFPALAGEFFTTEPPEKPTQSNSSCQINKIPTLHFFLFFFLLFFFLFCFVKLFFPSPLFFFSIS